MIKFVVILALFALFAAPAYGIKCYLCQPKAVENDAVSRESSGLEYFNAVINAPFCKDGLGDKFECPALLPKCVKESGTTEKASYAARGCLQGPDGCNTVTSGGLTKTVCICGTDLCNAAPLQRSPSMILLGAVGVLTFLFNALASRLN